MSSIYSGIKKVSPVGSIQKPNSTHTPPKQHSHTQQEKKPEKKKKDKDSLVDIYAEQSNFSQMLKNITAQNPKGSAAEQILLGKFLGSDQGTYARNILGKNHKGWIEHISSWLNKNKRRLQQEFTELDFSDIESIAYDMYENYLAKQGQLEESNVTPMHPLVVAGSPFNWDVYDLRTNKIVANVLGGDRRESPLYEIRINKNGLPDRMLPTYVLRTGPDYKKPYNAYELVKPEEGFPKKIEKSPGPGGTTKLHPDAEDQLRHVFKILGGGKYYGYDLYPVEEGLDQWDLVEKALGAKIMDTDTAMELDYTDWDPEDSSSIVYLGSKNTTKKVDEFFDAGGGGDDDDELKRQVIEMYKEDGLRELEIARITGLSEIAVHNIIDAYERGDFEIDEGYSAGASGGAGIDEGQIYSTGGGAGQGYHWYRPVPAGLKEKINYESAIMKGLQREETGANKYKSKKQKHKEIDDQIKKLYPYLVRNSKTGLEKEFNDLDDAIKFAQKEAMPSLDSTTVVYDRKSKFPVVAYRGKEDVYMQLSRMNEDDIVPGPWGDEPPKPNQSNIDVTQPKAPVVKIPSAPKFEIVNLYKQFVNTLQFKKAEKKGMDEDAFLTMAANYIQSKLGQMKPALLGRYAEQFLQVHKSMQRANKIYEYGEIDSSRKKEFSKENPPSLDYLYRQFIQTMTSPNNTVEPKVWIDSTNRRYGLNYTYKNYQDFGHRNDHVGGWDKFVQKHVLKK